MLPKLPSKASTNLGAIQAEADPAQNVILVPAFSGLGAPYWEPDVRGALFGLNRNTGRRELARAALEAVCYQTKDLVLAMMSDFDFNISRKGLRVDGGMVGSEWTMQFLADMLDCPIDRSRITETTAFGVAWLAGHTTGLWPSLDGFSSAWQCERSFKPEMEPEIRSARYSSWRASVAATIAQSKPAKGTD